MLVVRPITQKDTEAFIELAFKAGIGMTSMPKNAAVLESHVRAAEKAFQKDIRNPENEIYIFVLEDTETGLIVGTCGILSKTGKENPLYFYRTESEETYASHDVPSKKTPFLRVVHYADSPTEICSLYLSPEYRREGLGRLLSLSRFLFMACFPSRFDRMVFAEMRGDIDKNCFCTFWEGIGKQFFNMDFAELMHLRDDEAIDISKILPKHPIYISLLPREVQASIGKVHEDTCPAINMLMQEGFYLTEEIDVCDGGPKIEAEIKTIRAVKGSQVDKVVEIHEAPLNEKPKYLLCNNRINFRACLSTIQHRGKHGISISKEAANALQIDIGDHVRFVTTFGEGVEPKS